MKKIRPEMFSNFRFRSLVDEYVQGAINRQILIMFYVEDRTQEEIEYELHVSVLTIKRTCKRYGIPIFKMMAKE